MQHLLEMLYFYFMSVYREIFNVKFLNIKVILLKVEASLHVMFWKLKKRFMFSKKITNLFVVNRIHLKDRSGIIDVQR